CTSLTMLNAAKPGGPKLDVSVRCEVPSPIANTEPLASTWLLEPLSTVSSTRENEPAPVAAPLKVAVTPLSRKPCARNSGLISTRKLSTNSLPALSPGVSLNAPLSRKPGLEPDSAEIVMLPALKRDDANPLAATLNSLSPTMNWLPSTADR